MGAEICNNCKNYIRHYGLLDGKLYRLHCGHCTVLRHKRRYPDKQACENFVLGTSSETSFAHREYLSKKLLEKVLNMELLPEIHNLPAEPVNKQGKKP